MLEVDLSQGFVVAIDAIDAVCLDSFDNTLAFDVVAAPDSVVTVAAVLPTICPNSFDKTLAIAVAPPPSSIVCPNVSEPGVRHDVAVGRHVGVSG